MAGTTQTCLRRLGRPVWTSKQFSTSTSRRRKGPVAVFTRTSNEELNDILANLRETVFMPRHLNAEQRLLIYRKNWQRFITGEEPVRIQIEVSERGMQVLDQKESFTLQPLDMTKEPKHTTTFNKIIELMTSTPDAPWAQILPQYLRELHVVGRKVSRGQAQKLVQHAAQRQQLSLVIQCLRNIENMGFRLGHADTATELLFAAHQRAARAGFGLGEDGTATDEAARAELDRAIGNARNTIVLAEDPRHVTHGAPGDPNQSPELWGAAMALIALRRYLFIMENTPERAAAREAASKMPEVELPEGAEAAIENSAGETPAEQAEEAAEAEAEGEVAGDGQVLFAKGQHDLPLVEELATRMLNLSESANLECDHSKKHELRRMLAAWLPVWFGVQMAERVLAEGSSTRARLHGAFEAEIDPQVQKAVAAIESFRGDGNGPVDKVLQLLEQYKSLLSVLNEASRA